MRRTGLLALLLLPALAVAQPAPPVMEAGITIGAVKVEGNRRSEADAVLGIIGSRAGTRLDRERLRADLRAVFQLGFFRDVKVDLSDVEGTWTLTFIVEEKASIREVRIEGNKELDDDELRDVLDVKAFGILDLAKVNRNAEKIKDLYTEKGYFLAEVDWELIDLPDNQVDVLFRITEKQEVKVARIVIVGNRALSDDYITERLETRVGGFLGFMSGAGSFKAEAFERDQLRINQFYYDQGYIKARVGQPKVELSPDKSELYLTIPVEEGERFHTGPVDISGDFLKPKEELMKRVTLKEGDWFSSTRLRETMDALGAIYKDEGYAYVELVPQTMVDDGGKIVGLTIDIDKGKKVRFGRIRVVGNTRTRDKVIRRQLRIYEGEYYSSAGIERSQRLITRLGFFEDQGGVEIRTMRGDTDDTMDVMVEVKEKPTGTFQIGAGFISVESFVAQAQIAQNNLFGRGQSLSLQATLSQLRTIAQIRFADDYLLDTDIQFATNIYRYETSFQSFTRSSLGSDVTFGYPLSDDWSVSATYTLENVDVEEGGFGRTGDSVRIANYFNNGLTSSLRLALYWDTRNNRLFPSQGFYTNVSVEQAADFLGSENLFTRYRARYRYYYDLGYFMVLKLNTEWGLITSPDPNGPPIFERFFVGGPLSVRGFPRYSLGPTIQVPDDPTPTGAGTDDLNIGGTEQMIGNLEFEFPIFQKVQIRGVAFIDGGNAFDRRDDYLDKLDQFRFAWGFGVRWFSPIGPLRFEWGFPFQPREGEDSSVFDFSIGNFF